MKNQTITNTRFGHSALKALAVLLASTALISVLGRNVEAATPNAIGQFVTPESLCNPAISGRATMTVGFPLMYSSPASSVVAPGVVIIGNLHLQEVGTRAWLYKWNGASRQWVVAMNGPLFRGQAGDSTSPWYGVQATFPITQSGYYAVMIEAFWYADSQASAGYVFQSADHVDLRVPPSGQSVPYCTYK